MSQSHLNKVHGSLRVKEALVDALIGQTDTEVLDDAVRDGILPTVARNRVAAALVEARRLVGEPPNSESNALGAKDLGIDASRARAILKRVAAASFRGAIPLPQAAQLTQVKGDAEALEMVATLRNLGAISDDDLK